MGNRTSASRSSSSTTSASSTNTRSLLSPEEMRDLKQWVSREYPWIAAVNESMLLTDVRKPDCPIVQANIEFEMMTGYPSAEILGRNCRFLQGAGTSSAIVSRIRNAVVNGTELSVEILNYTKYGAPFVNAFTMYPIHRGGVPTGELRYFLAIQKNVTHIKQLTPVPAEWSTHEVVVWLDRAKILNPARNLVNAAIDGRTLVDLTEEQLIDRYEVTERPDIDAILNAIQQLQATTGCPESVDVEAGSSSNASQYVPLENDATVTRALEWWNTNKKKDSRVLVRVYRNGDLNETEFLTTATPDTEWKELRKAIESHYRRKCTIKYDDLKHSSEAPMTRTLWEQQRNKYAGQELILFAFPQKLRLSRKECAAFESSAAGVLVLVDGRVVFANSTFLMMTHRKNEELLDSELARVVTNFALDEHTSGFRKCFLVHKDGAQIGVLADARSTQRGLMVITAIPIGVFGSENV